MSSPWHSGNGMESREVDRTMSSPGRDGDGRPTDWGRRTRDLLTSAPDRSRSSSGGGGCGRHDERDNAPERLERSGHERDMAQKRGLLRQLMTQYEAALTSDLPGRVDSDSDSDSDDGGHHQDVNVDASMIREEDPQRGRGTRGEAPVMNLSSSAAEVSTDQPSITAGGAAAAGAGGGADRIFASDNYLSYYERRNDALSSSFRSGEYPSPPDAPHAGQSVFNHNYHHLNHSSVLSGSSARCQHGHRHHRDPLASDGASMDVSVSQVPHPTGPSPDRLPRWLRPVGANLEPNGLTPAELATGTAATTTTTADAASSGRSVTTAPPVIWSGGGGRRRAAASTGSLSGSLTSTELSNTGAAAGGELETAIIHDSNNRLASQSPPRPALPYGDRSRPRRSGSPQPKSPAAGGPSGCGGRNNVERSFNSTYSSSVDVHNHTLRSGRFGGAAAAVPSSSPSYNVSPGAGALNSGRSASPVPVEAAAVVRPVPVVPHRPASGRRTKSPSREDDSSDSCAAAAATRSGSGTGPRGHRTVRLGSQSAPEPKAKVVLKTPPKSPMRAVVSASGPKDPRSVSAPSPAGSLRPVAAAATANAGRPPRGETPMPSIGGPIGQRVCVARARSTPPAPKPIPKTTSTSTPARAPAAAVAAPIDLKWPAAAAGKAKTAPRHPEPLTSPTGGVPATRSHNTGLAAVDGTESAVPAYPIRPALPASAKSPSPEPVQRGNGAGGASPAAASAAAATAWAPPVVRSESRLTDEPDIIIPVLKHVYEVSTGRWVPNHILVRVLHPNRGLSQGSMRVAFEVEEMDDMGFSTPMVAKMFRHNITKVVEKDYRNECEAQCLCEEFADSFNKVAVRGVSKANISFLQCSIVAVPRDNIPDAYKASRKGFFSYRTSDTRDLLFGMEPRLAGNFTKYTSNFGDVYETNERYIPPEEDRQRRRILDAVEAFSHFTIVESGGSMLVCDLQGVKDLLTDPQIHTRDGAGLGMGNMGQEGIDKWITTHTCKELCRAMRLPALTPGAPELVEKRRGSYFRGLASRLGSVESVKSTTTAAPEPTHPPAPAAATPAQQKKAAPTPPPPAAAPPPVPEPQPLRLPRWLADMTSEEQMAYVLHLSELEQ